MAVAEVLIDALDDVEVAEELRDSLDGPEASAQALEQ